MSLLNARRVEGRKKGGGGSTPTESSDTLRSTQIAEVLDVICEGPVQGLVNGLKSVYLDGVPLVSPTGENNFEDVTFAGNVGTQGQAALHGFDLVQQEIGVGVKVTAAAPLVRTVTNAAVDTVRVTIGVPQLSFQDPANGDLKGNTLEYKIELQSNGGGYVEVYHTTLDGKCMSRYQRATSVQLTGAAPWDIRVTRVSADSATSNDVRDLWWDTYTEIVTARLRYPNSAVAGLRVNARQFSRIPVRAYDALLKVVQVPANYDPLARTYTGVWDGTFVPAWSNNPAWVFYDLLTHPRYGLGEYITASHVNKWKLYRIAQYCDQLVPDGHGGQEPRFTCNCYLQTQQDAYQLLQDLAALFRGIVIYSNGLVDAVQDAPSDAVSLFTPSNVIEGKFTYQGASERTRHSGAIVYWNNLANMGRREPELFQHPELVARYGVRNLELSPIGIWSRGEAVRLARWALYSEEYESEIVTFSVGSEGVLVPMGRVFKIADPNVAGLRLGGRVHVATTLAVTLDKEVTIAAGQTYTLTVSLPDPADPFAFVSETRNVTTAAGVVTTLDVSVAFDSAPAPQAIWILESSEVAATTWRCLGVREVPGKKNEYEITGVAHNPTKYGLIEEGLTLERKPISVVTAQAPIPTALLFTETVYQSGTASRSRITISWTPPALALTYRVSWRYGNGVWQQLPETSAHTVDVLDLEPGQLDVTVRSVNSIGNVSPAAAGTYAVTGKTTGPGNVTSLTATGIEHGIRLSGTLPPDPDLNFVEVWESTDSVQAHAVMIDKGLRSSYDRVGLSTASGIRYYWVRCVNTAGIPGLFVGPVSAVAGITAVPGNVTGLAATGIEHGIRLAGTLPADADLAYVEVWESTDNVQAHAAMIDKGLRSSYDRIGLTSASGTRWYWVRCVNTSGTPGAFVGPVSAVAGITAVPGNVTGLTATGIEHGIRLTGTLPADADLACVEVWESTDNVQAHAAMIDQGLRSSYDRIGLTNASGTRWYWVRCVNTSGTPGAFVGPVSAVAGITAVPGNVTGLAAAQIVGGIRITGTLPADVDLAYVELWWGTTNVIGSATFLDKGLTSSYDKTGLSPSAGTRYFWVRCVNTSGTPGAFVGPVSAVAGTADWSTLVTGLGKPSDNADNTTSILTASGTSMVMNNAQLFKSASGVAGVFIGSGGLIGKDGSGNTTFSLNGATGAATFLGDIQTSGKGVFGGAYTSGGYSAAVHANQLGGATVGVLGWAPGLFQWGVSGQAAGAGGGVMGSTDTGAGVYGYAGTAPGIGVQAIHGAGGKALSVSGTMDISSSTLVANLNAQYLNGNAASAFALASHIGSGTTISGDHDARYPNNWPCDSGIAYASSGMNFACTITGYRTRGSGNTIYLEPVSDARLKFSIQPEVYGREKGRQLRPVMYQRVPGGIWHHGFLASEMRKLFPDGDDALWTVLDDGAHSSDYQSLIALLVAWMQEQDKDLAQHRAQVEQLATQVADLSNVVRSLRR